MNKGSMRIFISTGEVSGDLQGALLVEALRRQAENLGIELEIVALGGDRMESAGAKLLGNTTAIGSMGIFEALPFILPTWQKQRRAIRYLQKHPPDLLILIDYAGPNVQIGSYFRKKFPTVPVVYYIAPQHWVWAPDAKKAQQVLEITDRFLAIFPEEARYFQSKGVSVEWVGHPLVDRMASAPTREESRASLGIPPEQMAIALLPASRKQELKYLLPVMVEAAKQIQEKLPDVHFWVPVSLKAYHSAIEETLQQNGIQATIVEGNPLEVIAAADLAITKSGTVNLEIALLNVPQVVLYRVSSMTIWVARRILKMSFPFMSPPNLVLMKRLVPEFFQETATADNLVQASLELLLNPEKRQETLAGYQEMRSLLGEVGVCDRAASEIFSLSSLNQRK